MIRLLQAKVRPSSPPRRARKLWTLAHVAMAGWLCLCAVTLLGACGSSATLEARIKTTVSVDQATQRATIHVRTTSGMAMMALFTTSPDGNRNRDLNGDIGTGGATLITGELSPGSYTYTVYAIPLTRGWTGPLPTVPIIQENMVATSTFTIP